MALTTNIGALIVCSPDKYHGRPHIAGTGITVHRIASWYTLGNSPEEIREQLDHLSLAQVYAALTYYHANKEQIDGELTEDDSDFERLEEEWYQSRGVEPRR
ncbi:MAG TPA: DUF433 domain-containing protein [Chloroflexia bacterium]|nr:DUF433 domain-containing protein [Chloroflexia bacterium]